MLGGRSFKAKLFGFPYYLAINLAYPYINRYRQARSGHLLVVNAKSWVGLFAHLEWFLEISLHCERHGLTPCFMSSSPQYVDPRRGPDWYDYFFTNPQLSPGDRARIAAGQVPVCKMDGMAHLGLPVDYDPELNLEIGPALVRKYIGLQDRVAAQVDRFIEENMGGRTALGIHYRGTDKKAEAPPVPYDQVRESVAAFLADNPEFDCIFVSSDEQEFVDFMAREFQGDLPVVWHDDRERSQGGIAVHRSGRGDGYRKAEEAVMNCLLLSRCAALIKTASFLSGWSKLFNAELPVFLLNPPHQRQLWFPDRDIASQPPDHRFRSLVRLRDVRVPA